ncbi:FimV/HubP family polar landmark protein [Aliiglaciecola litoralis]|uniref:L27 domain-containing protein n=1 Tax=Aliiglaciecola litoralis TaxID=582857 RepID=A0ABP3WYL1_9ALTE
MNVRQGVFLLIACIGFWSISASLDAQQVQIRGPKTGSSELSGTTYGPITPEDTLWRIANRYRQNKNLSVYQVMQAIYDLNPDAFEDQNFNHIKDGAILNLPSERYVARIDPKQAQLKAEQDDNSWQAFTKGETKTLVVAKPSSTVSKEDLSETKQGIEQKITDLDAEQNRQFMAIRQQFAESIDGVQSLLNENRKLVERLDVVDQEIGSLRGRVDEELQVQMDQMLALQNELLAISREAEMQRVAEAKKSSFDWLTDPIFLIFLSILLVISVLGAFAMWMIKRNRSPISSDEPAMDAASAAIIQQSDEMDDLADALANELSDDIGNDQDDDLFGDEDLLDDVLSEELEESLDSAIDEEFDSFDDLDDDSLDPIIDEAGESLEDDGLLDQDDLDNLFDEDDDDLLAEIDGGSDVIEEAPNDALEDETVDQSDDDLNSLLDEEVDNLLEGEIDDLIAEDGDDLDDGFELSETDLEQSFDIDLDEDTENPEVAAEPQEFLENSEPLEEAEQPEPEPTPEPVADPVIDDEPDKPEISIDELLEQPEVEIPDSIIADNSDVMNEEMLQNIDKEIASQNQQIDGLADELLNEIEQLEQMGGMLDEFGADGEDEPQSNESQMGIQALDALSEDIDEDLSDENTEIDDLDSLLAPDLAGEDSTTEETNEAADIDDIDNLLEQNQEADSGLSEQVEDETADIDDIDSLLEQNQEADSGSSEQVEDETADIDDIDSLLEQNQEADSGSSEQVEDETADIDDIDSLLEQNQEADSGLSEQVEDETADIDDIDSLLEQNQEADSGLSEQVEDETADIDDIDSLLEQNQEADSGPTTDDSDDVQGQQDDQQEDMSAQPSISNETVESLSADELLAELENGNLEEPKETGAHDAEEAEKVESAEEDGSPAVDEQSISEFETLDLNSPMPGEIEQQVEPSDALDADIEELDKALQEFEQDVTDPTLAFDANLDEQIDEQVDEAENPVDELTSDDELDKNLSEMEGDIPSIGDLDSLSGDDDNEFDDADLDEALKAFDEQLDPDELENKASKPTESVDSDVELDDLPGLGDWLSSEEAEEDTSIDELEKTSFDELLDSIDEPDDTVEEELAKELDETGLDFNALLNEPSDSKDDTENEDDFLDVDDLINESMDAEDSPELDKELNLDAALESYAGIGDAEPIDVDGDNGVGAKLDLAQAYIETDDIEAATELLEEIISSGDEAQQQEAKELLVSLKS